MPLCPCDKYGTGCPGFSAECSKFAWGEHERGGYAPLVFNIPAAKPRHKKRNSHLAVSFFGAPAGIRTPDTLLKRQVLCLLSYWGRQIYEGCKPSFLAGMAGLEPADEGVKVPCLTTWLHPYLKNHQGLGSLPIPDLSGVGEGARTLDTRNHNPVLCQLSYTHQISELFLSQ